MTYTRISDEFLFGPADMAAGEDASGLHLRALLWCNLRLTDGAIPAGALAMLTRRPDAQELAHRLVAAGLWQATATGWCVVGFLDEHPSREAVMRQREGLSAARSAAGRRGGLRSGEVRAQKRSASENTAGGKQAPKQNEALRNSESGIRTSGTQSSGGREETTTTTVATASRVPVRETPTVAVAAASASPSQPSEHPILRRLATASGGRYDWRSGSRALRAELAERLATYKPTDALIDRMGALLQTPIALWPWATKLGEGYVTTQWLLGAKSTDGEREAAMLSDLVGKAKASLRAEMEANARQARAKAEWDAAREAQAAKAKREADPAWQAEQRRQQEARVAAIRGLRDRLPAAMAA